MTHIVVDKSTDNAKFDFFFNTISRYVKENVFFQSLSRSVRRSFIDKDKLANQIARSVAVVVKCNFLQRFVVMIA